MISHFVSNTDFRARVRTLLLAGLTALAFVAAPVWTFSVDDVASKAKDPAGDKYSAPTSNLPSGLSEMKFADYQQTRSINERAYWGKLKTPFKPSFYHQDMYFDMPVKTNEMTATTVKSIKHDRTKFGFGSLKLDENTAKDFGYAGFRVFYPINKADKQDEIATFLGASYFRVVGKGQVYGPSACGLATDTALPSGEEFPRFREFWIERPKAQDKQPVTYALLDSLRVTGVYHFVLRSGKDAVMDVQARVFLCDKVSKLGLVPLTSMYLLGPNQPSKWHNFRPELHDPSGLQIHADNGEWLWRPLNNPRHLSVSTLSVENPKSSGPFQYGRELSRYEDLDNRYDLCPSAWIEPRGDWGKDTVELVEIPTPDEINDNIVASWSPETQPEAGKPPGFAYHLHWTMNEDELRDPKSSWVKQTMCSVGDVKQKDLIRQQDGSTALVVDLEGPVLKDLMPDAPVAIQVSTNSSAEVVENSLRYSPVLKGWCLTLWIEVKDPRKPVEMRAALVDEMQRPLSEAWSYQPPAGG